MDVEQTPHENSEERPIQMYQDGVFPSHFPHYIYIYLEIFKPV